MSGLHARLTGRRGAFTLDADITAPVGEVTALTGPSGSGKSTLLRAVAGLERMEGRVRLNDETWQDGAAFTPPHRRGVGFVFQDAALLPHLSVGANLRYGWKRARRPQEDLDRAIALTRTGSLLHRSPGGLSGGERRRVAVARALAAGPALLLLDEPLSGVDADARAELLPELRAMFATLAIPVIYVSHDASEVARISDRVVRMEGGRTFDAPSEAAGDVLAGLSASEVRRLAAAAVGAGLG